METDFVHLEHPRRVASWFRHEGLRQPFAQVRLALHARGLKMVDAETTHDRHEEGVWRSNVDVRRSLPANKRVLHGIFSVRHAAEHAVRYRKQEAAMQFEDGQPARVRADVRSRSWGLLGFSAHRAFMLTFL